MRIMLDLDGVIADFVGSAMRLWNIDPQHYPHYQGIKWDFWTQFDITSDNFWGRIASVGVGFWANLEPFPWMKEVIEVVQRYDPEFRICTSPTKQYECYIGKMMWMEKHLPLVYKSRRFHITPFKEDFARKDTILIDDYGVNCDTFCINGGKATLFRQPWSTPFYSECVHDWERYNAPGERALWLESQLAWYKKKYPRDFSSSLEVTGGIV